MNEEIINDLKQFIQGAVTQASSDIRDELSGRIDGLDHKVDNLHNEIGQLRTEMTLGFDELRLQLETIPDAH